jgi:hypothetical protein
MNDYAWNSQVCDSNIESYIDENELMRILGEISNKSIHTVITTIGANKKSWLKFRAIGE